MAIKLAAGRSGRHGRRGGYAPLSEINVTPLVDVMLVLLIVFMVTAPLLTAGVPVDLPKTQAAALNDKVEPLTISVDSAGAIYINDTPAPQDGLVAKLQAILANKPDTTIFVRGDRGIAYGKVMEVMGMVASAGFQKVSLIAQAQDAANADAPQVRPPKPAGAPR